MCPDFKNTFSGIEPYNCIRPHQCPRRQVGPSYSSQQKTSIFTATLIYKDNTTQKSLISHFNRCDYTIFHSHRPSLTVVKPVLALKTNNMGNRWGTFPMQNKMFSYGLYSHLQAQNQTISANVSRGSDAYPLSSRFLALPVLFMFTGTICVFRCGESASIARYRALYGADASPARWVSWIAGPRLLNKEEPGVCSSFAALASSYY